MGEHRRLVAERAIERNLLGRVRNVVVAANDVRDRHRDVVGDDGEVVDGAAIAAQDDEVVEIAALEG